MRDLGALETACKVPESVLQAIPEPDRQVVAEEAAASPKFCRELVAISQHPGWEHKVAQSAKCALLNELDPSKCKDHAGKWGRLRSRLRKLLDEIPDQVNRAVSKMTLDEKVAAIRKATAGQRSVSVSGLGELGQWDIISGLVGSVATATSNIYTTKIVNDTKEDIAKIQASTAMRDAQTQMSIANAQAAITAAQSTGIGGAIQKVTSATVAGVPVWLVAVPIAGLVIWMIFKK